MTPTPPQDGRTASLRVRLTPDELRQIKLFCLDNQFTVSEFVRWLIDEYLQNETEETQ